VPLKIVPRATLGTRAVGCRRLRYTIYPRCVAGYTIYVHYLVGLCRYIFAQWRNRQTTHFSERIPLVKRRISVCYFMFPSVSTVMWHRWWIHYWESIICGMIPTRTNGITLSWVFPGIHIWYHLLTLPAKTLCTLYVIAWIENKNIPINLNIETF